MATDQVLLFVAAGLLLNLTPGPDVLYIVSHALRSGARAGIVAAMGITAGCFVHIFAAAVGVSALMAASVTAFTVLKWAGAGYLVYVGLRLLRAASDAPASLGAAPQEATAYRTIFLRGFSTNALNPKVALFFLLFNFNALWVNVGWAAAAAWLARRSVLVQHSMRWLDRVAGALFVGFGIKLALDAAPQP